MSLLCSRNAAAKFPAPLESYPYKNRELSSHKLQVLLCIMFSGSTSLIRQPVTKSDAGRYFSVRTYNNI